MGGVNHPEDQPDGGPDDQPDADRSDADQRRRRDAVLRAFVGPDGRLARLPARRAKRVYWRSGGTVPPARP